MGTYVGSAVLRDDDEGELATVSVALARADPTGERWFGSVQGLDDALLDGRLVVVELPSGVRGRAEVMIDLTGVEPVIRLVGRGAAPV